MERLALFIGRLLLLAVGYGLALIGLVYSIIITGRLFDWLGYPDGWRNPVLGLGVWLLVTLAGMAILFGAVWLLVSLYRLLERIRI